MIRYQETFTRYCEREIVRLNARVDRALEKRSAYARRAMAWALAEWVAAMAAIVLMLLDQPVATVPALIASIADRRCRKIHARQELLAIAAHRASARILALVDCAAHPSRTATLIAPVAFDRKCSEASN